MKDHIDVRVKHMGIMAEEVDALVITYNPDRPDDSTDENRAVQEYGGEQFHAQLRDQLRRRSSLDDGVVVAETTRRHEGRFQRVVFVPDNGQSIRRIVYAGLCAADKAGSVTVALPLMRLGDRPDVTVAMISFSEVIAGIGLFLREPSSSIVKITIVDDHMLLPEMNFVPRFRH